MEIGSEFWLESSQVYTENADFPSWLKKYGDITLTSSGRGAISLLLEQIKPKIKRVLLPSYICESILIPFEKNGYELVYYNVDENFQPIENDEIENLEIGIFFHMGYFGFSTNSKLFSTILKLKSKSIIVIEDVTHTLFSEYRQTEANDFVIGSIRKWLGIPSGGFLASAKSNFDNRLLKPHNEFVTLRTEGLSKKSDYINIGHSKVKNEYLKLFNEAEELLDKDTDPYDIDELSKNMVQSINVNKIRELRNTNFNYLLEEIEKISEIKIVFKTIKASDTPLFFPVYVNGHRDELRKYLIENEIYCPVHWPLPAQLSKCLSGTTKNMYSSILSLPCDQRYTIEDMQRISNVIKSYFNKNRMC